MFMWSMVYMLDSPTIGTIVTHFAPHPEVLEVHGSLDQTTITCSATGCSVTGSTALGASSCQTMLVLVVSGRWNYGKHTNNYFYGKHM